MSELLKDLLGQIAGLPQDKLEQLIEEIVEITGDFKWVPNPGPQTKALNSLADELFYGGEAGGGKSDLLIGTSLTQHHRSLVLRRTNAEADKLIDRFIELIGHDRGLNRQKGYWAIDGRTIDIGGCQHENDKQKRKGVPHDLIGFDEITDFTETQYRFITGWNRSTKAGQRCRIICTGNPPTTPEGLWVTKRWGAWLDPRHPRPAKDGELRWYTTDEEGNDLEVDGPGPHLIGGQMVRALSRTFIRAHLSDNYDLAASGDYAARLAALPKDLRDAYRDGRFDLGLKDDAYQVIPSAWVFAAQSRWKPTTPPGIPMCAIGCDPAAGGPDDTAIACRYDGYYAELFVKPGRETPLGSDVAGLVISRRRDNAVVVMDMGGGYGLAPYEHLKSNNVEVIRYVGAEKSTRRTVEAQLSFYNTRAEAYWRLREALDPDQPNGSTIMLPPDSELVADLCVLRYKVGNNGIQITPKELVRELLGRSPGRGDAVAMAWMSGAKALTHGQEWSKHGGRGGRNGGYRRAPNVILQKPKG